MCTHLPTKVFLRGVRLFFVSTHMENAEYEKCLWFVFDRFAPHVNAKTNLSKLYLALVNTQLYFPVESEFVHKHKMLFHDSNYVHTCHSLASLYGMSFRVRYTLSIGILHPAALKLCRMFACKYNVKFDLDAFNINVKQKTECEEGEVDEEIVEYIRAIMPKKYMYQMYIHAEPVYLTTATLLIP